VQLPVDSRELSEWLRRCPACRGHGGSHVWDVPVEEPVRSDVILVASNTPSRTRKPRWVPCEWCGPQRKALYDEHDTEVETLTAGGVT
jgi:hypothetical protein